MILRPSLLPPFTATALLLLLSLSVAALAANCVRRYLAFRRAELAIPGPASLPLFGNALSYLGATHGDLLHLARTLFAGRADVFRITLLWQLILVVSRPEDIGAAMRRKDLQDKPLVFYNVLRELLPRGLAWLRGDEWRMHRRLLQPAFHSAALERNQAIFSAEAALFVSRLRPGVDADVTPVVWRAVCRSFLRAASDGAVGETLDLDGLSDLAAHHLESFLRTIKSRSMRMMFCPDFIRSRTGATRAIRSLRREVEDIARSLVGVRRRQLDQSADDASRRHKSLVDAMLSGSRLSDDDISGECTTFFGAAVESSVTALCTLLKVLSLQKDVQQRIHAELEEVFQGSSREITTADLERLPFTERVILESLRLFPVFPFMARECPEATQFAGHAVPAGTALLVNILGAHRDASHWPEPLRFDPDRFLPEHCKERHPHAYIPFSAGQRDCIGRRYAMRSLKTFLAATLRAFRVDAPAGGGSSEDGAHHLHQDVDVGTLPLSYDITLKIAGGSVVRLTPRATATTHDA